MRSTDTAPRVARVTRRQALRLAAFAAAALPLAACRRPVGEGARDGYGYIDEGGSWVAPPAYGWVGPFSEGRGLVTTSGGDHTLLGLVGADGELVADPVEAAPRAARLSQGFAAAHSPRLDMAYLDASGAWALYPRGVGEYYVRADSFSPADAFCGEAYAFVLDEDTREWGVLGTGGEWVIPPSFADVVHTYSGARPATRVGLAPMRDTQAPSLWGFVGPSGEWEVGPAFSDASWFHDDLARARDPEGGLVGAVDPSGAWALPSAYASVSFAAGSDGPILARDAETGLWGTADASGWVVPPQWRGVGISGSTGSLLVLDDGTGLWGVASPSGEWAVAPAWDDVDERSGVVGGLLVARDAESGLWGVASASDGGDWAVEPSLGGLWADAELSFPMPARDASSGLWGYVDEGGSWAVEPAFSYAGYFSEGLAVVRPPAEDDGEPVRIVTYVDGTPVPRTEDLPTNRQIAFDKDLEFDYREGSGSKGYEDWLEDRGAGDD